MVGLWSQSCQPYAQYSSTISTPFLRIPMVLEHTQWLVDEGIAKPGELECEIRMKSDNKAKKAVS